MHSLNLRFVPLSKRLSWVAVIFVSLTTVAVAQKGSWPRVPRYTKKESQESRRGLFDRVRDLFEDESPRSPSPRSSAKTTREKTTREIVSGQEEGHLSSASERCRRPVFEDEEIDRSMQRSAGGRESGHVQRTSWDPPRLRKPEELDTGYTLSLPSSDVPATVTRIGDKVTMEVPDVPITQVLNLIARQHGLNVVASADVTGQISVSLKDVNLDEALTAILRVNGYTWTQIGKTLIVSRIDPESPVSPLVQRQVKVFPLTYVGADDVSAVVTGLLSKVGKAIVTTAQPTNKLRTREQLVVEDLPAYVDRITRYIQSVDRPPRQVLIEAHVLRVELTDSTRHGVDFAALLRIAGSETALSTQGFTNPAASPAFFLSIDGTDLGAVLEALKSTTDAKTLASPKVLAVNGQEAKIQIGERLGYLETTTTQTSTLQSVEFLETGIVLNVTPVIGDDGQVLMNIKPEISSGRVNPETGLPEEDTTEVQTTVLLRNDQAMIVGGLISEADVETQSKVPVLGDMWGIGRAFQRRSVERERSEIIIALIPRILPLSGEAMMKEECEKSRIQIPLLHGPLKRVDRSAFEPRLPDAVHVPRRPDTARILNSPDDLHAPKAKPLEYYFPTLNEPHFED